jgi:hypothetical protein
MKSAKHPYRFAVLILAAVLVLGAALVGVLDKYFPGDPGEGLFDVRLVNDTSQEVLVQRPCTVDQPPCQYATYRDLVPGAAADVATSDRNDDQHYRVVTPSGVLVGCLPLRFQTVQQGVTVELSQALRSC